MNENALRLLYGFLKSQPFSDAVEFNLLVCISVSVHINYLYEFRIQANANPSSMQIGGHNILGSWLFQRRTWFFIYLFVCLRLG